MSEAYLADFYSGMSEEHILTWNVRSMEFRSVSEVYPASFDPCIRKPYLLMISSNIEISSILFLSFRSSSRTNLHYLLPLTLDRCRLLIRAFIKRASREAGLKCR